MTTQTAGIPRVLAIANGKGGVFKTSITAALGGFCSKGGLRVLVVDLDPQGNLTEDLGAEDSTDEGESTFLAVRGSQPLTPRPTGRDGLDIVYGGSALADVEQMIPNRNGGVAGWQHALAHSLAPIADDYDLIVLDCPPRSPNLTTMALVAAQYVLIPTQVDRSSRKGMREIAALFGKVRPLNPDLELLGVVITGVEEQATAIRKEVRTTLVDTLDGIAPVFDSVIRRGIGSAYQTRERGRLPHELENEYEEQERERPWWQLRRRHAEGERPAGEGGVEIRLPRSASGVSQDYAALTREVMTNISRLEQEAAR